MQASCTAWPYLLTAQTASTGVTQNPHKGPHFWKMNPHINPGNGHVYFLCVGGVNWWCFCHMGLCWTSLTFICEQLNEGRTTNKVTTHWTVDQPAYKWSEHSLVPQNQPYEGFALSRITLETAPRIKYLSRWGYTKYAGGMGQPFHWRFNGHWLIICNGWLTIFLWHTLPTLWHTQCKSWLPW